MNDRSVEPHLFIILGATGDLTRRKLLPALYNLRTYGELEKQNTLIVGASLPEMSEEAWDLPFDVDAKGVFLCSQAAIERMIPRSRGRIVNIGSIAGLIVRTNQIAYCSATAAAIHFTK